MERWSRRNKGWWGRNKVGRSNGSDTPTWTFKWSSPRVKKVWVPKIPSWEREFCWKVGLFKWDAFLEAKKYVHLESKIMDWDDSACAEAFNNAKSRFYAEINGLPCNIPLPDPNLYIDELDSSADAKCNDHISEIEEDDEESYLKESNDLKYTDVAIEDIKPTGWDDVKYEGDPLTGMIVGH